MMDRFYLPGPWNQHCIEFPEEEFHHLARVLRKQVGDEVEVFDGLGQRATAIVTKITKKLAEVQIQSETVDARAPGPQIELAVAPPKGERFKWLVEKCTELGIDRLIPLKTARSVVDPRESKLQKLDQTVIAACKQCRRDRLMELTPTVELADLLPRIQPSLSIFGDPAGHRLISVLNSAPQPVTAVLIIVGPEGGFASEEINLLHQHGARSVAVGDHILRIETAAIALAAACKATL